MAARSACSSSVSGDRSSGARRDRHVEVDARAVLGIERADPRRDLRAPVAALRAVARVPEARHQLDERACDARDVPAARRASGPRSRSRAATARSRGTRRRRAAVRLRVGEARDDVEELDDRARPAVDEQQRERVRVRRSARGRSGSTGRRSSVRKCGSSLSRASCARQSYVVAPVLDELAQVVDRRCRTPSPVPSIWSGKRVAREAARADRRGPRRRRGSGMVRRRRVMPTGRELQVQALEAAQDERGVVRRTAERSAGPWSASEIADVAHAVEDALDA